jgi:hypothetical protein
MNCKNCNTKEAIKFSKYSTGEFCCRECARSYSTKLKRKEINNKVSKSLAGRGHDEVLKKCLQCSHDFFIKWGNRNRKFCSIECAYKNRTSDEGKLITEKKCKDCGIKFLVNKKGINRTYCGKSCANKHNGKIGGLKSVSSQNRRSKNEVFFSELCSKEFNVLKFNEPMFNGWDADVIIEDLKIAILWNGKWHYEKITEKHSVEQVQNRDKIKIKEIIKCGYTPYIIKDMGKQNKKFVKEEFDKFITYCRKLAGKPQAS